MTPEQLDAYITHFRIQEITNKLRLPDNILLEMHPSSLRERSPDPVYDAAGQRTNTRPQRLRRTLEAERHRCVGEAIAKDPSYRLPHGYRRPTDFVDRLYIPQTDYPSVNFIGQILGPRGASLKALQERTGATIVIRGKGSVKEGRTDMRARRGPSDDATQPLHVVVTAKTQAALEEGKRLIQQVVDTAISTPDWQNAHKEKQLRDLAVMNGTFRGDEDRLQLQGQRQIVGIGRSSERITTGPLLLGPGTGPDANVDLDMEYERLMEDVEGPRVCKTNGQQQALAPLPPWRVDRLRRQGLL